MTDLRYCFCVDKNIYLSNDLKPSVITVCWCRGRGGGGAGQGGDVHQAQAWHQLKYLQSIPGIYISTLSTLSTYLHIYCVQTKQLQQPPSSYVSQVPGPGPPSAPAKAAPAPATESPPQDYLDQEPAAPPEVIRRHRTRCVLDNYRDLLED